MIYFNKESKGIKINTFLMLYKSLIRFQLRNMLILSIILERVIKELSWKELNI